MKEALHAISAVVRRTGLSAHVIRIWEKRYGAVKPERTSTNRRLYSDEQIERLNLLRELTQAGQSIGLVARLPNEELKQQLATATFDHGKKAMSEAPPPPASAGHFEECLAAVRSYDTRALERALIRAELVLGLQGMMQRVAAPLAQSIGKLWRDGDITAAHEHFASAALRAHLAHSAASFAASASDPVLVVTTPAGQLHELGALLVAAVSANLGWQVAYLGASLPASEIAGAARQRHAAAVALSLVFPEDDLRLEDELVRLRELLPPETRLIVGGRAAPAYHKALKRIGALEAADLEQLGTILDGLRAPARSSKTD